MVIMTSDQYGSKSTFDLLCEVFKLVKNKDPEEDHQAAHIEARRLLGTIENDPELTSEQIATVKLMLGKNCIDANDYAEAQNYLDACLVNINKENIEFVSIQTECLILLGVTLCKLAKWNDAFENLEKARSKFEDGSCIVDGFAPLTPEGFLTNSEEEMSMKHRLSHFNSLHTQCLYYLAQVHLHLGNKTEATYYCQKTLELQLLQPEVLDEHDWASNCASLAQVFNEDSQFKAAAHYLACALSMEDKIRAKKPNEYRYFHASMHRCMATLGLNAFEHCVAFLLLKDESDVLKNLANDESFIDQSEGLMANLQIDVKKIEKALPHEVPDSYDGARDLFLFTQRSLLEARDTYFDLESHCNDYIDITQQYSKLFKHMASIESDSSRRIAMHRRRVEMLNTLTSRLNPQFYLLRYRQLTYEMAETYVAMVDIEIEKRVRTCTRILVLKFIYFLLFPSRFRKTELAH